MSWALQHVELTLEDRESGEVVVIEKRPDGKVLYKVEEAKGEKPAKGERPAKDEKPARAPKRPKETTAKEARPAKESRPAKDATAKEAKPAKEARPEKPAKETKPATTPAKPAKDAKPATAPAKPAKDAKPATTPAKERRRPLAWRQATFDDGYEGYVAHVQVGRFVVVHAQVSREWALFFQVGKADLDPLGCFDKLEGAQRRAQELQDSGWTESEFGRVGRAQVQRACPVREEEPAATPKTEKAQEKSQEKAQEKSPPAPTPEAEPPAPATTDEALMRSFRETAMSMVEDDDED